MMFSRRSLKAELYMLIYLAINTNRALIIPNVILGMGKNIPNTITINDCIKNQYLFLPPSKTKDIRSIKGLPYCIELWKQLELYSDDDQQLYINLSYAPYNHGEYYWPGFRIMDQHVYNKLPIDIEELSPQNININKFIKSNLNKIIPISEHKITDLEILPSSFYYTMNKLHNLNNNNNKKINIPEPTFYKIDSDKFYYNYPYTKETILNRYKNVKNKDNCHLNLIWTRYHDIVSLNKTFSKTNPMKYLNQIIKEIRAIKDNRVVLDVFDSSIIEKISKYDIDNSEEFITTDNNNNNCMNEIENTDDYISLKSGTHLFDIYEWSVDSVNTWKNIHTNNDNYHKIPKESYIPLPFIDDIINANNYRNKFTLCPSLLKKWSNLTCFNKC